MVCARTRALQPEGETFDSSYKRETPTSFAPSQVIKGWTEAMQLMVQGDKWEMYIPSELGYGEGGTVRMPPPTHTHRAHALYCHRREATSRAPTHTYTRGCSHVSAGAGASTRHHQPEPASCTPTPTRRHTGSGANIKGGDVLVFTMEILSIDGPTTPADRGPPSFTEVTTLAEFAEWDAATGRPLSSLCLLSFARSLSRTCVVSPPLSVLS